MTQSIVFDRAAEYYDDTRGFPPGVENDVAKAIVQAAKLTGASRVLEFGIGTGLIALPLAKHVEAIYGIDLSRPMMRRLKAKQTDEPIYLVEGDATRLRYPGHSFDAVVGVHILHLIPNWRGVLDELKRVLKPDAPFVQCWEITDEVLKDLWQAWDSAVPDTEAADVGLSRFKNESTMQELGWRIGEIATFEHHYERTPAAFVQQIENRMWSRTWRLSDESWAAGLAAVKAAVARNYSDPQASITVREQYVAKPFYPPQ